MAMQRATFVVEGAPKSKPRPRVTRRGTFMPSDYLTWCGRVRDEASVVFAELADRGEPWDAHAPAYAIGCRFYLERSTGGDVDNLLGAVMDSLNAFAWPDDRLVVDVLHLSKRIDKVAPRVEVEIRVAALAVAS